MPDNDSNCPIKTRNDVTTPRIAITSASMLSRTYLAIKRTYPAALIACMSTFLEAFKSVQIDGCSNVVYRLCWGK